ncbi:hypothetical protein J2S74_003739 [Evansella vedderi]|uniref:Uncharacterized protein n=1 Tax=Evansella vedderi TaxID=38282 RepID=A0ABT9ZYK4_9BACI|nr:hypothetical protein [Evansella vedderi]MDQ0256319.1 hypothetical protein [Evansella vedderi]
MAKSNAKKKRDFVLRTTKRDVTNSRGHQAAFSTHVRKTKTKKEKLRNQETKHHKRYLQGYQNEGNAFLISLNFNTLLYSISPKLV